MNKWEILDHTMTQNELNIRVSNLKEGECFEAIGQIVTERHLTYLKIHAPKSGQDRPNCYKVEEYIQFEGVSHFVYDFYTVDHDVLKWFIAANSAYNFDNVLPGPIKGKNGYSIDLNENKDFYVVKYDNVQYCLVSKKNSLEHIVKQFKIEEE